MTSNDLNDSSWGNFCRKADLLIRKGYSLCCFKRSMPSEGNTINPCSATQSNPARKMPIFRLFTADHSHRRTFSRIHAGTSPVFCCCLPVMQISMILTIIRPILSLSFFAPSGADKIMYCKVLRLHIPKNLPGNSLSFHITKNDFLRCLPVAGRILTF